MPSKSTLSKPGNFQYDYIIAGAGCAGLSLAVHMALSGQLKHKKILLVDKDEKKTNDRTWCFWETGNGLFDKIVHKRWSTVWFHSTGFSKLISLSPYEYRLIRGIDFYTYCFEVLKEHSNVEIRFGELTSIQSENGQAFIELNGERISAEFIFNSILFQKPEIAKDELYLLQHFKGWIIETDVPSFDPSQATLMDFRVGQQYGTTFAYVMPFSSTRALVEYTLFTENLLPREEYDTALKQYISTFLTKEPYKIVEEEFGIIPMTDHKFPAADGSIINIGTAGGQTKASSGYTFQFIQKHSARIVENLIKRNNPFIPLPSGPKRFKFYDRTLLYILQHKMLPGDAIFTRLFRNNEPQPLFRFLDNESSVADELKIISSLPTLPFLKAAWKVR